MYQIWQMTHLSITPWLLQYSAVWSNSAVRLCIYLAVWLNIWPSSFLFIWLSGFGLPYKFGQKSSKIVKIEFLHQLIFSFQNSWKSAKWIFKIHFFHQNMNEKYKNGCIFYDTIFPLNPWKFLFLKSTSQFWV